MGFTHIMLLWYHCILLQVYLDTFDRKIIRESDGVTQTNIAILKNISHVAKLF